MRKEIARILSADAIAGFKASSNELADQTLSLLIEEMKKVRSENPYSADEDTDSFFAFDLACAKLLKRFSQ